MLESQLYHLKWKAWEAIFVHHVYNVTQFFIFFFCFFTFYFGFGTSVIEGASFEVVVEIAVYFSDVFLLGLLTFKLMKVFRIFHAWKVLYLPSVVQSVCSVLIWQSNVLFKIFRGNRKFITFKTHSNLFDGSIGCFKTFLFAKNTIWFTVRSRFQRRILQICRIIFSARSQ